MLAIGTKVNIAERHFLARGGWDAAYSGRVIGYGVGSQNGAYIILADDGRRRVATPDRVTAPVRMIPEGAPLWPPQPVRPVDCPAPPFDHFARRHGCCKVCGDGDRTSGTIPHPDDLAILAGCGPDDEMICVRCHVDDRPMEAAMQLNAHEALVEALTLALIHAGNTPGPTAPWEAQARAALALAENPLTNSQNSRTLGT